MPEEYARPVGIRPSLTATLEQEAREMVKGLAGIYDRFSSGTYPIEQCEQYER